MPPSSPSAAKSGATDPVQLKKADLLDQMVARTALKKRDAKPALDAALALIGVALARGETLILPPLGKIRVVKSNETSDGSQLLTLKLRVAKDASQTAKTGLATSDDDV